MLIKEIISYIETKVPVSLKEDFDNVGLLIGSENSECSGILITLDITTEIIQEAVQKKCNLIISHHPLILKGIKSITDSDAAGSLILQTVQKQIAVYALHTNLDNAPNGVNSILAEKIGLQNTVPLLPFEKGLKKLVTFCPKNYEETVRKALFEAGAGHIGNYDFCSYNSEGYGTFRALENTHPFSGEKNKLHTEQEIRIEVVYEAYREPALIKTLILSHPYEEPAYDCYSITNKGGKAGLGTVGELPEALSFTEFSNRLKNILHIPILRYSGNTDKTVKKIAVCGGSGSFLIPNAVSAGADVFLTADLKYHNFQLCENKLVLIDGGHYETEQFSKELIHALISEKFSNFAVFISEHNTNYTRYL